MKILYYIPFGIIGGAETQLSYLVKNLRKYKHDILIAFSAKRIEPFVKTLGEPYILARNETNIGEVIGSFQPDILQFYHSPKMFRALHRSAHRPRVIEVIHNRHSFNGDSSHYPKIHTDCAVCVSPDAETWFRARCDMGPAIPTIVIPNGIDTTRFVPRPPRPMRDIPVGGFTGRLIPGDEKGIQSLLGIVADLPVRLQLVGRDYAGWRDRCSTIGNVDVIRHSSDIVKYYHDWDFFVSRSPSEGFGMSIGEALACGLPSVIYDCGGICHYIEHGRHAILARTDREMVEGIRAIIAGADLQPTELQLGAGLMAQAYNSLYLRLLDEARPDRPAFNDKRAVPARAAVPA